MPHAYHPPPLVKPDEYLTAIQEGFRMALADALADLKHPLHESIRRAVRAELRERRKEYRRAAKVQCQNPRTGGPG